MLRLDLPVAYCPTIVSAATRRGGSLSLYIQLVQTSGPERIYNALHPSRVGLVRRPLPKKAALTYKLQTVLGSTRIDRIDTANLHFATGSEMEPHSLRVLAPSASTGALHRHAKPRLAPAARWMGDGGSKSLGPSVPPPLPDRAAAALAALVSQALLCDAPEVRGAWRERGSLCSALSVYVPP